MALFGLNLGLPDWAKYTGKGGKADLRANQLVTAARDSGKKLAGTRQLARTGFAGLGGTLLGGFLHGADVHGKRDLNADTGAQTAFKTGAGALGGVFGPVGAGITSFLAEGADALGEGLGRHSGAYQDMLAAEELTKKINAKYDPIINGAQGGGSGGYGAFTTDAQAGKPADLTWAGIAGSRPTSSGYQQSDWLRQALGQQQAALAAERARVESDYQARRKEITGRYSLTESADEKRRLAGMLADLEGQRTRAHGTINEVYGKSIADTAALSKQVGEQATVTGDAAYAGWKQAAQDAAALNTNAMLSGVTDGGAAVGLAGGPVQGAAALTTSDFLSSGAGARQSALAGGQAEQQALATLQTGMADARAAGHKETDQIVIGERSATQREHADRVAERIATDKAAMYAALDALANGRSADLSGLGAEGRKAVWDHATTEAGREDAALNDLRERQSAWDQNNWTMRLTNASKAHDDATAAWQAAASSVGGGNGFDGKQWSTITVKDDKGIEKPKPVPDALFRQQLAETQAAAKKEPAKAGALWDAFLSDPLRAQWMQQNNIQYGR